MRKHAVVLLVLSIFLITGAFGQNVFGPDLKQAMENNRNGEFPVIVMMKQQFDVAAIKRTHNVRGNSRDVRNAVFSLLESKCKVSQHWVRNFIENAQRSRSIKNVHYFWLVNAISFKANATFLRELALQTDIKGIYLDQTQVMVSPLPATRTKAWGVKYIKADQTQGKGVNGNGIVVAVCDTGVDLDHPGFAKGQVLVGKAKSFISNEPTADDGHGHGTHCAGTIGSRDWGVAPGCQIVPVKVLSRYGSGSWSGVMQGVEYAAKIADVISMSLGGRANASGNVVETAVKNAIRGGVVCVIAAGNSGHSASPPYSIGTPGVVKEAITVGAIDSSGNLAYFSSIGPTVYKDEKPDIVAPGVDVPSLWKSGGTKSISGTSMATPHVAGLVALILSVNKNHSPAQVKAIIMKTTFGKQEVNKYGKGCVDAVEATKAAK